MFRLWFKICQAAIWLYFSSRLFMIWSRLYRFIYERKYKNVQITNYKTLKEVIDFTDTCIWTKDSWRELFDAVSTAEKVEFVGHFGNKHIGDCDEFAVYNAVVINNAIEKGDMPQFLEAKLMAVMWMDPFGKTNGHNVALINMSDKNVYTYMDYYVPSVYCITIDDVAAAIVNTYARGSTLLGYAISDPRTLKLDIIKLA